MHPAACFIICFVLTSTHAALGFTTSQGQLWGFEPDAWTRANDANTAWFGWDVLELPSPPAPNGPLGSYLLNDSTPDIGAGLATTGVSFAQSGGSSSVFGHLSSSGNYYSGWPTGSYADDTITGATPASGTGGYTTLLLQVIGQPTFGVPGLSFSLGGSWTKTSDLYGVTGNGSGLYWLEWTAAGAEVPFAISMTSTYEHVSLDALQIDAFWTAGAVPVTNGRDAIGAPEPGTLCLAVAFGLVGGVRRAR